MTLPQAIKPLFILAESTNHIGKDLIKFVTDDYNKGLNASLIDAVDDAEAIATFLQEYKDSYETLRSYAKEIERLLLWCIHIATINISSLRRNHLMAYLDFLKNPLPKKIWCGPSVGRLKKDGSFNSDWRPFVKGLGVNSIKKSIKILDSFFNYLVQTNYLTGNPLAVDRRRKRRLQAKPIIDRYLELDEIKASLYALSVYPVNDKTQEFQVIRARYIILLLFYSGLRIAEAANHCMGNFMQREGNWFLRVVGKGKKLREIPVPDELLQALANFREQVGLPTAQPKFREEIALIPMHNLKKSISPRRIDQILKWAFNLGAHQFEPDHPQKASKLRQASAHWLRHSYVTYLLDSGAPLKVAQENAGHSDIGTTMLYRHMAQTDRFEATRHLSLMKTKKTTSKTEA
jgi:site-specific recombinase XerD